MPLYIESADRPWIKTGNEANLLSSRAKPYQLGFATDTKKLYLFDVTKGSWLLLTRSAEVGGGTNIINIQKDGSGVGQRATLNFVTGINANLSVIDNNAAERIDITVSVPYASADTNGVIKLSGHLSGTSDSPLLVDDVSIQKIQVQKNHSLISTRSKLNFIDGNNITISITDNNSQNKTDITISSLDEKVKSSATDTAPGYLESKIDGSIILNNVTQKIQLAGDVIGPSSYQCYSANDFGQKGWFYPRIHIEHNGNVVGIRKTINFIGVSSISDNDEYDRVDVNVSSTIEVAKDGSLVGTRKRINFITGTNQTLSVIDDNANNRVNIKIDIPDATNSTKGVVQLTGHLGGTATSPIVVDDTSNQKVRVSKDGILVGTRRQIDFVTGMNQTLTVSDDSANNRVNVKIDIPNASSSTRGVVKLSGHLGGTSDSPVVLDDTSNQRVNVLLAGINVGTRKTLNFINTSTVTYNISDDTTNNRINIQSNIVSDSSVQKVEISKDGTVVGTRKTINYQTGNNQTLVVSDDTTNNRVNVRIDVPDASTTTKGVIRLSGHLSGTADSPTVVDDTSNQRVNVLHGGTNIGTRKTLNFINTSSVTYTITNDSTNNRINIQTYTVDDSSTQRVEVAKDGVLIGTRKRLNYQTGTNQTLTITDNNANNRIDIQLDVPNASSTTRGVIRLAGHLSGTADSPTVVDDTSNQRVGIQNNGTLIGTRKTINFIPGSNISYTITDDATNNRVNITISSAGGGVTSDEKVKAHAGDPTAGYLSDKVDNSTVKVDTTNHRLYVPSDSSTQRVEVSKDGTLIGTRKRINFQTGTNQTLTVIDDTTNNNVNVKIDVPDATTLAKGVIQLSGHLSGSSSAPIVVDDTSNQRVNVQQDGVSRGTRKSINFVGSGQITYSVTDNIANNRIDIQSSIVNDSSVQKVESASNGTLVSTRKRLNFINSSSVSVSVSDDVSNNRTNISYTVTDDSSVQKTEFSKDGTLVGTRRRLNIVGHNTADVTLVDNGTNNRVDMTIATKLDNNGSLTYTTSGIKLKDDENAAAYYCYTVPGSGGSTRQWQPIPLSIEANSATLNVAFNLTTTETIIDGGGANPIFQLVLSPGKWFVIVYFEGHIRGNTGSSAGTYQNLLTMYMRTGNPPTDTFVQNMRLNYTTQNANVTLGNSLFNSINKTIILTTAYDGQTQDIRGNIVTGTVIYFTGRYTVSGGATVNLSQLLSTCTLQAARIHII